MTDKTEAPERTAIEWHDFHAEVGSGTPYIREDVAQALVAAAYDAAWRAAFRACRTEEAGYVDENSRLAQRIENELRLAVAGAIKNRTPADARAALDRLIAEAVEAEREACIELADTFAESDQSELIIAAIRARKSPPAD